MKGRKRTKKHLSPPMWKEPTPREKVERAAEYLLREAVESNPKFKGVARRIATAVRRGASKLVRGARPASDEL